MVEDSTEPEPLIRGVQGMRQFLADVDVQRLACFAVADACIKRGPLVLRAGGLEAIISAMETHGSDLKVQYEGCQALYRLAEKENDPDKVLALGGLEAVKNAMDLHPEHTHLHQEALLAIKNMAARNAKKVLAGGGLEIVEEKMERFPQASWVQMWGCQALKYFAEVNLQRVSSSRGFELGRMAAKRHAETREGVALAAGELAKLDPDAPTQLPPESLPEPT